MLHTFQMYIWDEWSFKYYFYLIPVVFFLFLCEFWFEKRFFVTGIKKGATEEMSGMNNVDLAS